MRQRRQGGGRLRGDPRDGRGGQSIPLRRRVGGGREETVKAVTAELGKIDILVNNAGITRDNLAMMLKEEDFDAVIETNLKGAFLTMKPPLGP